MLLWGYKLSKHFSSTLFFLTALVISQIYVRENFVYKNLNKMELYGIMCVWSRLSGPLRFFSCRKHMRMVAV